MFGGSVISVRRFILRPSGVAFEPTGSVSLYPADVNDD